VGGLVFARPYLSGHFGRVADGLQRQLPPCPCPKRQRLLFRLPSSPLRPSRDWVVPPCVADAFVLPAAPVSKRRFAFTRCYGFGAYASLRGKSGRCSAVVGNRSVPSPTVRICQSEPYPLSRCLCGSVVGCKVAAGKVRLDARSVGLLDAHGRFRAPPAAFEWRLAFRPHRIIHTLFRSDAARGVGVIRHAQWGVGLPFPRGVDAFLPTRAVASGGDGFLSGKSHRRGEGLSSPPSPSWTEDGRLVRTGAFPKPPKAPFPPLCPQRLHFCRHRRGGGHRGHCACVGVLWGSRFHGFEGDFSNERCLRFGGSGGRDRMAVASSHVAHCGECSPHSPDRGAPSVRECGRVCPVCDLDRNGAFAQCSEHSPSRASTAGRQAGCDG